MKPGNYYIGDPCYALKNEYIDDFIDSMTYGTTSFIKEVDGKTIFFAKTSSKNGTGEIAPIPPVFKPVSPSPILL